MDIPDEVMGGASAARMHSLVMGVDGSQAAATRAAYEYVAEWARREALREYIEELRALAEGEHA